MDLFGENQGKRYKSRAVVRKQYKNLVPKGEQVFLEKIRPFLFDLRRGIPSLKLAYCLIGHKPDIVTEKKLRHKPVLVQQLRDRPDVIIGLRDWLIEETTLEKLDLYANHMWPEGAVKFADGLKENVGLTHLQIRLNQIGDEGCVAIAEALKTNQSLKYLDLYGNGIGESGVIALASALRVNRTLQTLHLRGNQLGDTGAIALAKGISENCVYVEMEEVKEGESSDHEYKFGSSGDDSSYSDSENSFMIEFR
eukprot:g5694.t1